VAEPHSSTTRSLAPLLTALFAAATLTACGGAGDDGGGPTEPLPVVGGLDFTLIPGVGGPTVVEFEWIADPAASAYRLEIGSTSGAWDVAVFETTATRFTWADSPLGELHARGGPSSSAAGRTACSVGHPAAHSASSSVRR
jgi:hypothetical protein